MAEVDMMGAQAEHTKAVRINAIMQAITAVPVFTGDPGELEFFLRRTDVIVNEIAGLEESTHGNLLGFLLSRLTCEVIQETGISLDTTWDDIKRALRVKYGGAARSVPRLILREVLVGRDNGESATNYAKAILRGFRKVQARMKDATENAQDVASRTKLLEELATEMLVQNLPHRTKQWVRIVQPSTLEKLVATVEEDEMEAREGKWEEPRRRQLPRRTEERRSERNEGWQQVIRRPRDGPSYHREKPQAREWQHREQRQRGRVPARKTPFRSQGTRRSECWECKETGHFARECPYIFRRHGNQNRSHGSYSRYAKGEEPMEVNSTRTQRYHEEAGSESDCSVSSQSSVGTRGSYADKVRSYADRGRGAALPRRKEATTSEDKPKTE